MNHPPSKSRSGALAFVLMAAGTALPAVSQTTFSNTAAITVNDNGAASVYPSSIVVSGMTGTISKVTIALINLSHANPDDIDVLLVGPTAAHLVLLSDAGGSTNISGITPAFDDAAASALPDASAISTGTWRPSSYAAVGDTFAAPAPAPSSYAAPDGSGTFASAFNGTVPNGTWSLYVMDDTAANVGTIAGGWSVTITTVPDLATTTAVGSSLNPSFTGDSVTFTATVTSSGNPVTVGTVTFADGVTSLGAPIAVDGSGQATLTTSALAEGSHLITATYNAAPGFATSNGSVTQVVNDATVVTGNEFCNPGSLAINAAGPGAPYPANIFVSGLTGSISTMTLTLAGLSHGNPDDIDLLLVGPTGATLVPMSDVGGTNSVSSVDLTLDDAAANLLPDSSTLSAGTYRPTSQSPAGDVFPAPAPAAPSYAAPDGSSTFTSLFGGTGPNGTWRVYVTNDGSNTPGSIASGVCLTFTLNAPDLSIQKTHTGSLTQGQTGAQYTITVTNEGADPTVGTVTVVDTLPAGLTATAIDGSGWVCVLGTLTCTRTDVLAGGGSYPPITLTVDVASNAPPSLVNGATVSGGGQAASANDEAADPADVERWQVPALGSAGRLLMVGLITVLGLLALRRT